MNIIIPELNWMIFKIFGNVSWLLRRLFLLKKWIGQVTWVMRFFGQVFVRNEVMESFCGILLID